MKNIVAFGALGVALVLGCSAQTKEPAPPDGGWTVDKAASTLEFTASQSGKEFTGSFSDFDAAITLDPADLSAARIEVTIDMGSATTGDRQRDAALPSVDWFSAKAFPEARFSSTRIATTGQGAYEAEGALTIRGASKDLTLPFTLKISGDKGVADGAVTLVRTDFGVGQGEFESDEFVGFNVGVRYHIEASR